ncbi:hypothetical protein ACSEE7_20850 [Halomonas cupida]|uniref:hypothetical protein n=1 Tax=Halomonas TaxID=2745 RepID=UPI001A8FF25E|nr:hypothetical protein [Halomonas litopenaei]MBN8411136.1 hypothetical protein [Halomonas litopenaei]
MQDKAPSVVITALKKLAQGIALCWFPVLLLFLFVKNDFSFKVLAYGLAIPLVVYLVAALCIWLLFGERQRRRDPK